MIFFTHFWGFYIVAGRWFCIHDLKWLCVGNISEKTKQKQNSICRNTWILNPLTLISYLYIYFVIVSYVWILLWVHSVVSIYCFFPLFPFVCVWGELRSLGKIIIICFSLAIVCMQKRFQWAHNQKLTQIDGNNEILISCKFNERRYKSLSVQRLVFGVHFLNGTAVTRNWNRIANNVLRTYININIFWF